MKHLTTWIFLCLTVTGCAQLIPGLTQAIDDAVTDEACQVTVDKAAMQPNTDIDIAVKITHQSAPQPTIHVHTNQESSK